MVGEGPGPFRLALALDAAGWHVDQLREEERPLLQGALPGRVREAATGRWCARRAMQALGHPALAVPAGRAGEPCWPPGLTGSITHKDGLVCAAVAEGLAALGIDLERVDQQPQPRFWRHVLRPEERPTSARELMATFSAKEAFFKMAYPEVRRWFGFQAARVILHPPGGGFTIQVMGPLAPSLQTGARLEGNSLFFGPFVLSWICR